MLRINLVSILLLVGLRCFSQNVDSLLELSHKLKAPSIESVLLENQISGVVLKSLFEISTFGSEHRSKIKIKELEAKNAGKDIGLLFNVVGSFRQKQNYLLDDNDNSFVPRLRAEIEWGVFKGGFLENKALSKKNMYQRDILLLEQSREDRKKWTKQFRLNYHYAINNEILELCYTKRQLLNTLFDIQNALYTKRKIPRSQLLNTSGSIHDINSQIEILELYKAQSKDSINSALGDLKLPFLCLHTDFYESDIDQQQQEYELKIIKQDNDWFKSISLSFYLSYNIDKISENNAPYVGFRFKMPLRLSNNKAIEKEKENLLRGNLLEKKISLKNAKVSFWEEYKEKIRNVNIQHENWNKLEEQRRKLTVLRKQMSLKDAGGLELIDINCQEFDIVEKLLETKKQLYTQVARFIEMNDNADLFEQVKVLTFEQGVNKNIYKIAAFSIYGNDFRIDYLKAGGAKYVFLENPADSIRQSLLENKFIIVPCPGDEGGFIDLEKDITNALGNIEK